MNVDCVCGHGDDGRHDAMTSETVGTIIACPDVPAGEIWGIDARYLTRPKPPRVLARITEEDTQEYRFRCETCGYVDEIGRSWSLALVAEWAHNHAVSTSHAVLVEAL